MQRAGSPAGRGGKPIITCGICFGVLKDPVTLGCTHSFCTPCVRSKLDKAGMGDGFTCLLCNQHHNQVSIRSLGEYVDVELSQRIERMRRGDDTRPMCQWCEESPASLFCPDCQYTLCSECNVAVHKNAAKRQHAPQPIQDGQAIRSMTRKCDVKGHEEYRLEFYCTRCEDLCCAYCLQIAPHAGHESVLVSKAAQDVRQRMGRDLDDLAQVKTRIEGMANELNRVTAQYFETYDYVESSLIDRFNAFRNQLMQREVEIRKMLQNYRDMGDASLAQSRMAYLLKLNSLSEAGMTFRRLQHGGADFEVLQNRATMSAFLRMDVPQVAGSGFRLSDLGDLTIAGLDIGLDLHSSEAGAGVQLPPQPMTAADGYGRPPRPPTPNAQGDRSMAAGGGGLNSLSATPSRTGAGKPKPLRFTFRAKNHIEVTQTQEGVVLRCSDNARQNVGVHARETFEMLKSFWREDHARLTWRIRLDNVRDTYVGIVEGEAQPGRDPLGYYWQPCADVNSYECAVGTPTPVVAALPQCKARDVLTFTFDTSALTLQLAINNADKGTLIQRLHTRLTPCFIMQPGEALTVLPPM